jgi:hypothetical protein
MSSLGHLFLRSITFHDFSSRGEGKRFDPGWPPCGALCGLKMPVYQLVLPAHARRITRADGRPIVIGRMICLDRVREWLRHGSSVVVAQCSYSP